jgi:hypothetical protein
MAIYAKKTDRNNPIFKDRATLLIGLNGRSAEMQRIPIPDDVTLCNGCNENIETGYLLYLSLSDLNHDRSYDFYCEDCLKKYFPKAKVVA